GPRDPCGRAGERIHHGGYGKDHGQVRRAALDRGWRSDLRAGHVETRAFHDRKWHERFLLAADFPRGGARPDLRTADEPGAGRFADVENPQRNRSVRSDAAAGRERRDRALGDAATAVYRDSPRRSRGQYHALFRSHARTPGADPAGADRPRGSAGARANQGHWIPQRHRDTAGDDAVVRAALPPGWDGVRVVPGAAAPHAQEPRGSFGGRRALTRRQRLAGPGIVLARRPRVVHVTVPIADLPSDLAGFRILQLSDLHIGPTIRRRFVDAVVDRANSLRPDLVAVTGDVADGLVPDLRDHVAPLARLRAPHGAYFVTGNHEYYWDVRGWMAELERLAMEVLSNEHRIVQRGAARLLVAGVTDLSAASDPAGAVAGAPPSDVRVVLAHQPRSAF